MGCANSSPPPPEKGCNDETSQTPSSFTYSGVGSAQFRRFAAGLGGGNVSAKREYEHRVVDYALSSGAESCRTCATSSTPLLENFTLDVDALFRLSLVRTFQSRRIAPRMPFGNRWGFNYDIHMDVTTYRNDRFARLNFEGGRVLSFVDFGTTGDFVEIEARAAEVSRATLEEDATGWLLTTKFGEKFHFVPMNDDVLVGFRPDYLESRNGFRIEFSYDTETDGIDRLVLVRGPFGRTLELLWGLVGTEHVVTEVVRPDGLSISYDYASLDEYTVTYPSGDVSSYALGVDASEGPFYAFNDVKGNPGSRKHRVFLDEDGQIRGVLDPEGNLVYASRWIDSQTLEHEYPTGKRTRYTIGPDGYPRNLMDTGLGVVYDAEWDSPEHVVTRTVDVLGGETNYQYDGHELTNVAHPDGSNETFEYTGHRITGYTDQLGRATTYEYDASGNLDRVVHPDGASEAWTYNGLGQTTTYTDACGRVTAVEYDAFGNAARIVLPDEDVDPSNDPSWSYTHDVNGLRLTEIDPIGRLTVFEYDALDRIVRTTFPDSTTVENDYGVAPGGPVDPLGPAGLLVARRDRNGNERRFEYDVLDNLVRETLVAAHDGSQAVLTEATYLAGTDLVVQRTVDGDATSFSYDTQGRLQSEAADVRDGVVLTTSFAYDAMDRVVERTDPYGFRTRTLYDAVGRAREVAHEAQRDVFETTTFVFDAFGNPTQRTDPRGGVWQADFDAAGRIAREVDPLGGERRFTYDACGNVVGETDEDGNVITRTYTARDQVASVTDPSSVLTVFSYFSDDRVECISMPAVGFQKCFTYLCCGRLSTERTFVDGGANDIVVSFQYDGNGNQVSFTDGEGFVWTKEYDERDRLVKEIDPLLAETWYAYHEDGSAFDQRLAPGQGMAVVLTAPGGRSVTRVDDRFRRPLALIDGMGEPLTRDYDLLDGDGMVVTALVDRELGVVENHANGRGRLVRQVDRLGSSTRLVYDPNGNNTEIIDALGGTTRFEYDARNVLNRELYADGGEVLLESTAGGRLSARTDQEGVRVEFEYDPAGRLTKRRYPGNVEDVFTYDAAGRVVTGTTGLHPTGLPVTRSYDAANRLVGETQSGRAVTYTHDRRSLKSTLATPSGVAIENGFDSTGRLDTVSAAGSPIVDFDYDSAGFVSSKAFANGTRTSFTYDGRFTLATLAHERGAQDLLTMRYTRDAEGNRTLEENATFPDRSVAYSYDAGGRLVRWARRGPNGSVSGKQEWDLDALWNWERSKENGAVQSRTHDAVNQIIEIDGNPLGYDARGNLTEHAGTELEYDIAGRLGRVVRGGAPLVEYAYDAFGRRVAAVDPGGTKGTLFFYDGLQVVEERSLADVTVAVNVFGGNVDETLARLTPAGTFSYHVGPLFDTQLITDAAGAVVERYDYSAYGTATIYDADFRAPLDGSAIDNPYMFTGRRLDARTGYLYFRNRDYSPELGRFTTRDPAAFGDGANFYAAYFVPSTVDPLGLLANVNPTTRNCIKGTFAFNLQQYLSGVLPSRAASRVPNISLSFSRQECEICCDDGTWKKRFKLGGSLTVSASTLRLPPIPTPVPGLSVKLSGSISGGGSGSYTFNQCTQSGGASGMFSACAGLSGQLGFHAPGITAALYGSLQACVNAQLVGEGGQCSGKACLIVWGSGSGSIGVVVEFFWFTKRFELLRVSASGRRDVIVLF
ncbi:MAG: RHS repeat protein [bacterium]|nr:RHS repeat protein [bacterium]